MWCAQQHGWWRIVADDTPRVERRHPQRRREDRHRAVFVTFVFVVVAIGSGFLFSRIEADRRSDAVCASQVDDRRVLRAVIREAFASPGPVKLPSDPRVPQATIDYLQRFIDGSAGQSRAETRQRLLDTAPALRCQDGVPIAVGLP